MIFLIVLGLIIIVLISLFASGDSSSSFFGGGLGNSDYGNNFFDNTYSESRKAQNTKSKSDSAYSMTGWKDYRDEIFTCPHCESDYEDEDCDHLDEW